MSSERLLLRVEEAADRLAIGRSKTYELIRQGILPSVRLGRTVRVPLYALEHWIAEELERQRSAE